MSLQKILSISQVHSQKPGRQGHLLTQDDLVVIPVSENTFCARIRVIGEGRVKYEYTWRMEVVEWPTGWFLLTKRGPSIRVDEGTEEAAFICLLFNLKAP